MARTITGTALREQYDKIVQALERGESFVLTHDGATVGNLTPSKNRQFVSAAEAKAAFAGLPRVDYARFRQDVDAILVG